MKPKNIKEIIKNAKKGDADAQCDLGLRYAEGIDVEQDFDEALKLFDLSAKQGNARGQFNLGLMYYSGDGVKVDFKKAYELFVLAAEQGDGYARHYLGMMLYDGDFVKKDRKKAVDFLTIAAEKGVPQSQFFLGWLYENGETVKQNLKKAAELYELAVEQGDSAAQFSLGRMYASGDGVKQNIKKAVELFTLAAEQGDSDAEAALQQLNEDSATDGVIKKGDNHIDFSSVNSVMVKSNTVNIKIVFVESSDETGVKVKATCKPNITWSINNGELEIIDKTNNKISPSKGGSMINYGSGNIGNITGGVIKGSVNIGPRSNGWINDNCDNSIEITIYLLLKDDYDCFNIASNCGNITVNKEFLVNVSINLISLTTDTGNINFYGVSKEINISSDTGNINTYLYGSSHYSTDLSIETDTGNINVFPYNFSSINCDDDVENNYEGNGDSELNCNLTTDCGNIIINDTNE